MDSANQPNIVDTVVDIASFNMSFITNDDNNAGI